MANDFEQGSKSTVDILKKANAAIHQSKAFFKPRKLDLPNEYTDFPTAGDELMINTEYVHNTQCQIH